MRTAVNQDPGAMLRCPGCSGPVSPGQPHCANCRIWLAGPQAAELWWIDSELGRVVAARSWLVGRRLALLTELYDQVAGPAGHPQPAGGGGVQAAATNAEPAHQEIAGEPAGSPAGAGNGFGDHNRREVSAPNAARLLVGSGAALVVIAATAFTVANWGQVSPLARCAILLAATIPVLAAPRAIARRGLKATAESVAVVGLALTIGDAYLAGQLAGGRYGSSLEAALATAALAGLWAGYGRAVRLRAPVIAAICLAQLPGLFGAAWLAGALGAHVVLAWPLALALVVTACADLMFAAPMAQIAGAVTWTAGILLGCAGLGIATRADLGWLSCVCAVAAVAGLEIAPRRGAGWIPAEPVAAASGALLAAALAIPATLALPHGWELAAGAFASAAVTGAALALGGGGTERPWSLRAGRPSSGRRMDLAAAGSAAILACCAMIAAPVALLALQPPHPLARFWTGASHRAGRLMALPGWPAIPSVVIVLALAGLACLLGRARGGWPAASRAAGPGATTDQQAAGSTAAAPEVAASGRASLGALGLVAGALAAGALPAAAGLAGWAAVAVLTGSAGLLLAAGAWLRAGGSVVSGCGAVLGAAAVSWSVTSPVLTIAVLGTLTALFGCTAVLARRPWPAALSTAGCLAGAAGLAWAVPLAAGWPARYAAFAVLAVAFAAIGVATWLRRSSPVQALVLDAGAGLVVLGAGLMAARSADAFAVVAAAAALAASATAWLRTGRLRIVALAGAAYAILAAVSTQWGAIAAALFTPYRLVTRTWHGHELSYAGAAHRPDLPLAVAVLAICLAAVITAAGAWRGSGRASLDAVAVALPLIAAPAGLAAGLGYVLTVGLLLMLAFALTAWAALGRSLAPAGAAVVASSLALAWALAAPVPTLIVLGCLTAGYAGAAWRARLAVVRVAAACLTVLCCAAFAECAVLAAGRPAWQAGLAVLATGAAWQGLAAGAVPGNMVGLAAEVTAWLAVAWGTAQCLGNQGAAIAALAASGLTCLAVASRPSRRPALGAGLALCEAAWCVWLARAGVGVPEPYVLPVAAAALAVGWQAGRRHPTTRSWLTYGPGLAALMLPSLVEVWSGPGWQGAGLTGWVRTVLLGLTAVMVAVTGARRRLQAPLLLGSAVVVLDAGRELAPAVRDLAGLLPGWVPIAALGAALLWAGATYEARLRNLGSIRGSLAAMR